MSIHDTGGLKIIGVGVGWIVENLRLIWQYIIGTQISKGDREYQKVERHYIGGLGGFIYVSSKSLPGPKVPPPLIRDDQSNFYSSLKVRISNF